MMTGRRSGQPNGANEMKTRKQALQDEFNDLEEEFYFCGSHDERRRCVSPMQAILAELSTP
jgi:hypothetical protein